MLKKHKVAPHKRSRLALALISVFIAFLFTVFPHSSNANEDGNFIPQETPSTAVTDHQAPQVIGDTGIIQLEDLKGINRIIFSQNFGPKADKLLDLTYLQMKQVVQKSLSDIFSADTGMKINPSNKVLSEDKLKNNNLFVEVILSARESIVNEKKIKAASIYLQLSRLPRIRLSPPITYPFIVPATSEEQQAEIAKGIRYLAGYLPSYISCANKIDAHPCAMLLEPYGETP